MLPDRVGRQSESTFPALGSVLHARLWYFDRSHGFGDFVGVSFRFGIGQRHEDPIPFAEHLNLSDRPFLSAFVQRFGRRPSRFISIRAAEFGLL